MTSDHQEPGPSGRKTLGDDGKVGKADSVDSVSLCSGAMSVPTTLSNEESTTSEEASRPDNGRHAYITGLYGVLAIESFVWTYFQTFIPSLTVTSLPGQDWQSLLRIIFNVPLWNGSLIYNFVIILSMRNVAVSFLRRPDGQTYSATVIRRILRLVILVCVASGMATLIFSQVGVEHIEQFKLQLPNDAITPPMKAWDALAALNSLFDFFWLTEGFYTQAANNFWPTGTLWVTSVIYYQSFTVYFLMVILPFTRPTWHFSGMALFALGSYWMGSWGWYSATGLLLADLTVNKSLRESVQQGLKIRGDARIPFRTVGAFAASIGLVIKYSMVFMPQYINSMLVLHPFLDLSGSTSVAQYAEEGPYPRLDDWFLIVGIMLLVELRPGLQRVLSLRPLVWIGNRLFSLFTAQCIVLWTAGISLWLKLLEEGFDASAANGIVLAACLPATIVAAESFYWLVDRPSRWACSWGYKWLTS